MVMWPYRRPVALRTLELRSHWGVSMEKLAAPDWEDACFPGVYATLEKLGELGEDEADRMVTGQLPTIPEGQTQAFQDQSAPNRERGTCPPGEPVKEWTLGEARGEASPGAAQDVDLSDPAFDAVRGRAAASGQRGAMASSDCCAEAGLKASWHVHSKEIVPK